MKFETFICNGQSLHAALAGPEDAPVVLMLHGFPEYWAAWADVAPFLSGRFRLVMPDQRGINRSSKPEGVENYRAKHLVADLVALIEQVSPGKPVFLCGHDWGASIAYALAIKHPDLISKLVIANGVHPICFQRALLADPAQREASQYMTLLRQPDAPERMAADGFAKTFRMLEKFSSTSWLDDAKRAAFREAWGYEDALTTMLHWYSSSPMEVRKPDEPYEDMPITPEMEARFRIAMPHLLLWGMDDTALLPSARADLPRFCNDLTIVEIEGASHWLLHETPEDIAGHIERFLAV